LNNLYKLEHNNNILIRYFNINKSLVKNSSFIRIKNRCVVSGRSHAVHRLFKLSRIKLRELGSHGKLMGLSKAS
jgi:ribosomal protein S14